MFMIMKRFRGDFGVPLVSLLPCPFFVDLGVGSPWGSPLTLSCLCWGGHLIPCLFSWQGVCVDHLKRCKTCNTSWAGPLPIPFTIPLVWYCCVTKLGRTLTQFVNHSSGLVLLLNQKNGQDPYPFREPFLWSGLLKKSRGARGPSRSSSQRSSM